MFDVLLRNILDIFILKITVVRISLVVQWLRLCSPNAGGPGLILGQGTRSHMLQL